MNKKLKSNLMFFIMDIFDLLGSETEEGIDKEYENCIDRIGVIADLVEESLDGWIPCTDKKNLPERFKPVLVSDTQDRVCIRHLVYGNLEKKNQDSPAVWSQGKTDVVAWKPLPESYHYYEEGNNNGVDIM